MNPIFRGHLQIFCNEFERVNICPSESEKPNCRNTKLSYLCFSSAGAVTKMDKLKEQTLMVGVLTHAKPTYGIGYLEGIKDTIQKRKSLTSICSRVSCSLECNSLWKE